MNNHIFHILDQWYPQRNQKGWACALVVDTEGPVYRKAGAIMLISDQNDVLGMLSGGCLESDLQLQAQRVIRSQRSHSVSYDAGDEGSLAWQLGIGCGGVAHIAIQPCTSSNNYLSLDQAYHALKEQRHCQLEFSLADSTGHATITTNVHSNSTLLQSNTVKVPFSPLPHLLIFGAGVDVVPIVNMATALGWKITVVDRRASHFKPYRFASTVEFYNHRARELDERLCASVDAVIIASHSLSQDAEALVWTQSSSARYCGLLGPAQRRARVLKEGGLSERDLRLSVAGPMGLALGGELPESIALSVLAECHAVLFGGTAKPLSQDFSL